MTAHTSADRIARAQTAAAAATPTAAAVKPRRKAPVRISDSRRRIENLILQVILIGSFMMLWEYASDRWVPKLMVSKPSEIGNTIWRWLLDGTFASNLWVTLQATIGGFLLGTSAGMLLGFLTGSIRRVGEVLQPIVTAFYTLPRLALAPLFLLWFGLGMEFRIMFSATIVFFLVYYNTYFGVREVSRELISAVRIMGANHFQVAARVIIPSALVWVAAGLKISVPYSLVGVVVAEMLASDPGHGLPPGARRQPVFRRPDLRGDIRPAGGGACG